MCEMYSVCTCTCMTIATIIYPSQHGDSAVISATQYHHSEALKELVAAGANLNHTNQVKFQLLWPLYHVSSPAAHETL